MNQCNNGSVILIPSRPSLQGALGAALGAVVAGLVLTGGQAKALVVDVGAQNYDVTTFTGSYDDNEGKFNTTDMPWWNLADNGTLAREYALAVKFAGEAVGGVPLSGNGERGPVFAYSVDSMRVRGYHTNPNGTTSSWLWNRPTEVTYAILAPLVRPTASVPGPLPILGLAAAFGFSRQLRKRIKSSTNTLPSSSAS